MNINKIIHGPNVGGQSLADRVIAAKHSLAGQGLAKTVCKATTEEVIPPKKKHIDTLIRCSHEPNVSVPQLASLLFDRSQNSTWVVVYKALLTTHTLMNYGNERFLQYVASNNCSFSLENFMDRTTAQGYDMSPCIRRYARYLNAKGYSYRHMAYDFCKIKKGKEDGILRVMETEKLLKALPVLQVQIEALLDFDVTRNDLTNSVINASFLMLFKDLIRLLACYNDAIINLLAKYFGMSRKQCKEALDLYKKFIERMELVAKFLAVAESIGIERGDIPDLAKAPSSLLEALETHLKSFEKTRKGSRAGAAISDAIGSLAAAQHSINSDETSNGLSFAESSVLAANNPFADLLSSSDATPDSVAGEDFVGGEASANNPFEMIRSNGKAKDVPVAGVVKNNDPWSSPSSSARKVVITGFATEEQFAAAFGSSTADFNAVQPEPVNMKKSITEEKVVLANNKTAESVKSPCESKAADCNQSSTQPVATATVSVNITPPESVTPTGVEGVPGENMATGVAGAPIENPDKPIAEDSVVKLSNGVASPEDVPVSTSIRPSPVDHNVRIVVEPAEDLIVTDDEDVTCGDIGSSSPMNKGDEVEQVVVAKKDEKDDQNIVGASAEIDKDAKAVVDSSKEISAGDEEVIEDDDDDSYLDLR